MKLLLENWRRYLTEDIEDVVEAEDNVIDQLLKTSEIFKKEWIEMEQSIEGALHHHGETSAQHTMNVLNAMEGIIEDIGDEIDDQTRRKYRLMAALHDIGKPGTRTEEETGRIRFFGHADAGAAKVREILEEIGESDVDAVVGLVKMHMDILERINLLKKDELTDKALNRFIKNTGSNLKMLAIFTKANLKSLIAPDIVKDVRGEDWEVFEEEINDNIRLVDQLMLRVKKTEDAAEKKKMETPQNPVEFAKGLAGRGLPAEQIKNILINKFNQTEQEALDTMKGVVI